MIHYSGLDDTIAAVTTPPGIGAIGIVRLSGTEALNIASTIFKGKDLLTQQSHTLHYGHIINREKEVVDEVVVSIFLGPKSYTGENMVEISGHGSPLILSQILETCIHVGARLALPGEFTQRAFLNGKMDLVQAEAVGDLIHATSKASQQSALHHLKGKYSADLNELRDRLIHFSAMIELELDFADEDVEFADRAEFYSYLADIRTKTNRLLASFKLGNAIKNGIAVAIIGRPNAGKSTLLNALLNEERAIVSDIAGTTRDTIEESLHIKGYLFRLIDTAGIRHQTDDIIESMGIERSKANAQKADIILYVRDILDSEEPIDWMEDYKGKTIEVWTKWDLFKINATQQQLNLFANKILLYPPDYHGCIEHLSNVLFDKAIGSSLSREDTVVTNARHYEALTHIADNLEAISRGLDTGLTGDLLALDIRSCLYYLGLITGRIDVDRDVLGKIFSSFCIGK